MLSLKNSMLGISPYFFKRHASRLRLLLLLAVVLVVGASIGFTVKLASELRLEQARHVAVWAEAQSRLLAASEEELNQCDFTLHSMIQSSNVQIPLLLCDEEGRILDVLNYGRELRGNEAYFEAELQRLRAEGSDSLVLNTPVFEQILYFSDSYMIRYLDWFPYLQFGLLGLFLLLSYFLLIAAWRAEQERVWVGMAKETAHQLGTPISSLMGWVENLKVFYEDDEDIQNISDEISKDVELLQIVAERFSKIGTSPELEWIDLRAALQKHLQYIEQRASRKVKFDFPPAQGPAFWAKINPLLFDWVIENLLKNALDAMESKEGRIEVRLEEGPKHLYLDVCDTGKGMPRNLFKKVFEPGFSTKKRGWGLGLSLSKRIVERYHQGKIFVLQSTLGQGTCFRIQLNRGLGKPSS